MAAVERHLLGCVGIGGNCFEYLLPDAAFAPTCEAIVDGLMRSVFARAVLPATANSLHVHDAAQNPPVVFSIRTRLVGRQMGNNLRPLLVIEPKEVRAHRLVPESVDQAVESTHG